MKKIMLFVVFLLVASNVQAQVKSASSLRMALDSPQTISLGFDIQIDTYEYDLGSALTAAASYADQYGGVVIGEFYENVYVSGGVQRPYGNPYRYVLVKYDDSKSISYGAHAYPVGYLPSDLASSANKWPLFGSPADGLTVPLDGNDLTVLYGFLGVVCGGLLGFAILNNI